jgi:hypothetical protein
MIVRFLLQVSEYKADIERVARGRDATREQVLEQTLSNY